MAFDRSLFSNKLKKYCDQLLVSVSELSFSTGINLERINKFLDCTLDPTGDEILIFADFFRCDYKFFISNEREAPFEQTDYLFRRYGQSFTKEDRTAVQEILYLAECEEFLLEELNKKNSTKKFDAKKIGGYYKDHGRVAAEELREVFNYADNQVPIDVFNDFREIGLHVFRRKLGNTNISGLCIRHPKAGKCVLVNYDEDIYRQRFTVAHEVGHALFDLNNENEAFVSFSNWTKDDLVEIRANSFASHYLLPRKFLISLSQANMWDNEKIVQWSEKLNINPEALTYALSDVKLISEKQVKEFSKIKLSRTHKKDSEVGNTLSKNGKMRKKLLLEKGLSDSYVSLCINAYRDNIISLSRMVEMLLINEDELLEIMELYNERV